MSLVVPSSRVYRRAKQCDTLRKKRFASVQDRNMDRIESGYCWGVQLPSIHVYSAGLCFSQPLRLKTDVLSLSLPPSPLI